MSDQETIRILHMEDDKGLARLFQRRLERAGFEVDVAEDGQKGLKMFAAGSYHLLVLDQRMPKMSGIDVIKELAAAGKLIPTIMLTGAGSESVAVEAMKLGASDYIIKDPQGRYLELMPAVAKRAVRNYRLIEEKRRADEDLRRSKETIEALFNATTDMAALIESNGTILEFNQPFARTYERSSSELIGRSIFDFWPTEAGKERRSGFDQVLRTRKSSRHEDLHDGRFYDNTFCPVFGDDGAVVAVAAFSRDITEQKLAQAALQSAHDELEQRVVERTAELAAANKDLRGEIAERGRAEQALTRSNTLLGALRTAQTEFISNRGSEGLFDGLLTTLLSLTDSESGFVGEVLTTTEGEPYLKIRAITTLACNAEIEAFFANNAGDGLEFYTLDNVYGKVIKTGKPVISNSQSARLPTGHPPINSFLGLPFHVGEELIGMVGIANRPGGYNEEMIAFLQPYIITSANLLDAHRNRLRREWAEEQLRTSEERFRTVFESARDCIFIKDTSGAYTLVNPEMEHLLNLPRTAILGKTDHDIYGKGPGDHLQEVDARVLTGEPVEQEHTRIIKGVPLTFLDTRVPMRNAQDEVVGIIGISRNITDRKVPVSFSARVETEYRSQAMQRTLREAKTVALSDSIVMLTGESGSGKDYLARFIHAHSKRATGPFFSVNCAAVPAELAESELFGHEAGAFTGAARRKRGLLELAEGGTLLLNEIGELSLNLQAKLLTFLDTRSFTRVGGTTPVSVSARLITATNRDLQAEVAQRRFRNDLFYRLNVFSINVPPLRERIEDLPFLVQELLTQLTAEMQLTHAPDIDTEALSSLESYSWPGNVRELRNVLERALMLSGGGPISVSALGFSACKSDWSCTVTFPEGRTLRDVTSEITQSLVCESLRRCRGSKRAAARLLGISHDSLYRFLRMYGIEVAESDTGTTPASENKTER